MRNRFLLLALVLLGIVTGAAPARAGGWASVRLDGQIPMLYRDTPWTVGLLVKQHDRTPVDVDRLTIAAVHRGSGETVAGEAVRTGEIGHYRLTLTFPEAGEWKWTATPEPFAGSGMPTLHVLAKPGDVPAPPASTHPVRLIEGSCAAPGDTVLELTDTAPVDTGGAAPLASSRTTVDRALTSLNDGHHAIVVLKNRSDPERSVACGDIGGVPDGHDLVIGLQQTNNSGDVGIAIVQASGTGTVISVHMLVVAPQAPATGTAVEIHVVPEGADGWRFEPAVLEIAAGTTVTWVNETAMPHTVSGARIDFADSGYLDPGASFSQTFATAGQYTYQCDPHPWMTGEIIVR